MFIVAKKIIQRIFSFFLIVLLASACKTDHDIGACNRGFVITFQITAPPMDSIVYLTGNSSTLKDWNPKGVAVDMANGKGEIELCLPRNKEIEFKITAGSWSNEAIYKNGTTPRNSIFKANQDTTIKMDVYQWKDDLELTGS